MDSVSGLVHGAILKLHAGLLEMDKAGDCFRKSSGILVSFISLSLTDNMKTAMSDLCYTFSRRDMLRNLSG